MADPASRLLLVSATRRKLPEFVTGTLLGRSLLGAQVAAGKALTAKALRQIKGVALFADAGDQPGIDLAVVPENATGLATLYNRFLAAGLAGDGYLGIVFVHDDVAFLEPGAGAKLRDGLAAHPVIGLAGARMVRLSTPCLWHRMARPEERSGRVAHPPAEGGIPSWSEYGPVPRPCVVVDGCCLGVRLGAVADAGLGFDEAIPTPFHFYDLLFCLGAVSRGLGVSTWPVAALHGSKGLVRRDRAFQRGEEYFQQQARVLFPGGMASVPWPEEAEAGRSSSAEESSEPRLP